MKTKQEAQRQASRIIKRITVIQGFRARVYENQRWHFSIEKKIGSMWVSIHQYDSLAGGRYNCMIGYYPGTGLPGWYHEGYHSTPDEAIRASVKVYENHLRVKQLFLDALKTENPDL